VKDIGIFKLHFYMANIFIISLYKNRLDIFILAVGQTELNKKIKKRLAFYFI